MVFACLSYLLRVLAWELGLDQRHKRLNQFAVEWDYACIEVSRKRIFYTKCGRTSSDGGERRIESQHQGQHLASQKHESVLGVIVFDVIADDHREIDRMAAILSSKKK